MPHKSSTEVPYTPAVISNIYSNYHPAFPHTNDDLNKAEQTENGLSETQTDNNKVGPVPLRFLMLFIFAVDTIISNLTYSMYPIVGDVVAKYFGVDQSTVNWSSMVLFLGFDVAFLPSVWMFNKIGLKLGLCVGTSGIAVGYWILCASFDPGRFWAVLLGQSIVGACQVCFFTVSARVASVWFGSNEVSRACAVGVFSNMLGVGLSCIIPPLVINGETPEVVRKQLSTLNYVLAGLATFTALLTILAFKEQPVRPPSQSQALLRNENTDDESKRKPTSFFEPFKHVTGNGNYLIQMVSSGLVFSLGNTIATSMNAIILSKYPDANKDVGVMGLLTVFCGIPAGLVYGAILDKTHRYKETAICVVFGGVLSLVLFVGSIYGHIWLPYLACVCIGIFLAGYPTVGFEMAAEVSYPATEILSAGLCMCFANLVSVPLIYFSNWMIQNVGVLYNNILYVGVLCVSFFCACIVRPDLRRLAANESKSDDSSPSPWKPAISVGDVSVLSTVTQLSYRSNQDSPSPNI